VYVCVQDLGFPGVQIGSHINDWNLEAPELLPFFQVSVSHSYRVHLQLACVYVC